MTEAEWLACTDPQKMLEFLRGKASDRKLRLFAVACCRHIWHRFTDKQGRKAVEIAERLADGQAEPGEVAAARTEIEELLRIKEQQLAEQRELSEAAYYYGYMDHWPLILAESAVGKDVTTRWVGLAADTRNNLPAACKPLVEFLHDIFGLFPFRTVTIAGAVRAWNNGIVMQLAHTVYNERRWGDMPILADALEEAGCTNADILGHLRGPGPHVRGCWPVDLCLGKS